MDHTNYEVISIEKEKQVRFYTSIDKGSFVAPHWHDAVEVIYMEEGSLTVRDDTGITEMKAGDCLLINANFIHTTKCVEPNRAIVFQIPLKFLDQYIPNLGSLRFEINTERAGDPKVRTKIDQFTEKLERMQYLNDENPDGGLLLFNGLLYEALFQLYHDFSFKVYETSQERHLRDIEKLEPLLNYVGEHYTEHISVDEAASMVGFEPRYFCRFFKNKTGVTFLEYQNDVRLVYILRDLQETNDPIQDILERHGFTNYKVFRRVFREKFGMTPGEFRGKR